LVSPDGSRNRPPPGSDSAPAAVPVAAGDSAYDTHIYVRRRTHSAPQTWRRATGPPPKGKQTPAACNIPYIPAGTQTVFLAPL
jgi:hypothetical protein